MKTIYFCNIYEKLHTWYFSLPHHVYTPFGAHSASYPMGTESF